MTNHFDLSFLVMFANWRHWADLLVVPIIIQILAYVVGKMLDRFVKKKVESLEQQSLLYVFSNAIKGSLVTWCSSLALYLTLDSISFVHPTVNFFLSSLLYAMIAFSMTCSIARTVSGIIDLKIQRSDETTQATSLLTSIIKFIIYSTGTIIILQHIGISVTPFLTALGVGGMAVALGLQDTLANIFAGLHIIISKQMHIGDFIKLSSGELGQVDDINWRYTKIRSLGDNLIIVPNKTIASANLTNYNMPSELCTVVVNVGVGYESDLEKVEAICIELGRDTLMKVEGKVDFEPFVRFYEFGDCSINLKIVLSTRTFLNQYRIKHEMIKAVTSRFRQENINIPFPIRTLING